jgi:hypothetical protein
MSTNMSHVTMFPGTNLLREIPLLGHFSQEQVASNNYTNGILSVHREIAIHFYQITIIIVHLTSQFTKHIHIL